MVVLHLDDAPGKYTRLVKREELKKKEKKMSWRSRSAGNMRDDERAADGLTAAGVKKGAGGGGGGGVEHGREGLSVRAC